MNRFLIALACFLFLTLCSCGDKEDEAPGPNPDEGGATLCLRFTEKALSSYTTEDASGYATIIWGNLAIADVTLTMGGKQTQFNSLQLHQQANGSYLTDTMEIATGDYQVTQFVLHDSYGREVASVSPTTNNTFTAQKNMHQEKGMQVQNKVVKGDRKDSLAIAALMEVNFGSDQTKWPIDVTKGIKGWPYVTYDADRARITSLNFGYGPYERPEVPLTWEGTGLKLKVIPPEIELLDAVLCIDFSGNDIETLPKALMNMKALQMLRLDSNKITEVPESVLYPIMMETVVLSRNPIKKIPVLKEPSRVKYIEMFRCQLTALGEELRNYPELQNLVVTGNQITSVGDLTTCAPQLQYLDLMDNRLTSLAENVFTPALRMVNLSHNLLTALPAGAIASTQLETMEAVGNQITALPAGFTVLPLLDYLDLSKNRIASLPEDFGKLNALFLLNLSDNLLTALPAGIEKCDKLRRLDLRNNPDLIWEMPEVMKNRYSECVNKNETGEPTMGTTGLFVDVRGSLKITGVPEVKYCDDNWGGDNPEPFNLKKRK